MINKIFKKIFTLSGISLIVGFIIGAYLGQSTGIVSGGGGRNGAVTFGIIGAVILFLIVKVLTKKK